MAARVSMVLALVCSVSAAPSGLRAGSGLNSTATTGSERSSLASTWAHPGCCSGCGTSFCSPNSGTCYNQKGKYYYLECRSNNGGNVNGASSWQHAGCCSGCGTAFCSPNSGTCYDQKGKYYYLECRGNSNGNGNSPGNSPGNSNAPASPPSVDFIYVGQYGCRGTGEMFADLRVGSASQCRDACRRNPACRDFTYGSGVCGLAGSCQLYSGCIPEPDTCYDNYHRD